VTHLEVSKQVVDFGIANGIKVLVGTSGWTKAALSQVEVNLSDSAAVVVVPNFSIGSVLASKFASEAGKYFDSIEIIETHHAGKVDSPSGTAIRTAELIADSRNEAGKTQPLIPAVGQSARGEVVAGVPIHSLRIDGVSAKQDVVLGGSAEVLTISHQTSSVQAYSLGILESLKFTASATGLVVGLDKVLGI
jgi:4-hydroxy-tetrahydrodipicolinate reductase